MSATLWGVVVGAASSLVASLLVACVNARTARIARVDARTVREEERAEARRIAEAGKLTEEKNRLRELYKRALQAAADFRMLSDFPGAAEQWRAFLPRLHELRADFTLYASDPAAAAFDKYIDHIDDITNATMHSNEPDDGFWKTIDSNLQGLEKLLRAEFTHLRVTPGPTA